jgi:hypothetical protein
MKRGLRIGVLAFCACIASARFADALPLVLTSSEYIQELDKWQQFLESGPSKTKTEQPSKPDEWIVRASAGDYHVATDFLDDIDSPDGAKRALTHIEALLSAAIGSAESTSRKSARSTAENILSRSEFFSVRAPGIKESYVDRITQMLLHFFEKLFGKAIQNATAIRAFVTVLTWSLLLAGVSILFFWIFRALKALSSPELGLEGLPDVEFVSAKAPESWLADARNAAANGQYRLAICLAYWTAIAGLERGGAWRPDRARTPREYLRNASDAPFLPVLRALTRDFERTWYANQPATAAAFDDCLLRLKELGWQ